MSASAPVLSRSETLAADQIYERRWALSVLDQVLARLGDEYRAAGQHCGCLISFRNRSRTNRIAPHRRRLRANSG